MALLNNPVAQARVRALYVAILRVWEEERGHMNEAGCDLCGSNDRVDEAAGFYDKSAPPYLCLKHRHSWGVSWTHNKTLVPIELKFARWLAAMVNKEAKKHATQ